MKRKSATEFQTISSNQIATTKGCNAVLFENKGDVKFYVNGYAIAPLDSPLAICQEHDTEDVTVYHIAFDVSGNPDDRGVNPQCGVITTYDVNY